MLLGPEEKSPTSEPFERFLLRGDELLRGGDAWQARTHAEQALSVRPDDPDARRLLALSLFHLGQLERALVIYEGLLLDAPESVSVKVNLAVVLLKLGRASAARPLLESVVAASPEHRSAWGYLGVALEQLGLIAEAEGALLSGHHSGAVKRLRQRHVVERAAPTAFDLLLADRGRTRPPIDSTDRTDHRLEGVSFEQTIPPRHALPPPAVAGAARERPTAQLLDEALSSLLIVPHRVSALAHPGGFVVVRLVEGTDVREGGFVARADLVRASSGSVERGVVERGSGDPSGVGETGFARWAGTGRLVLAARPGAHLLPLHLDADVAFLREERVGGFDQRLVRDTIRVALSSGPPLALARFRGDGEVILDLERPPLALEVRDEAVRLGEESLVGWTGSLTFELVSADVLVASGTGTLIIACTDPADAPESWGSR